MRDYMSLGRFCNQTITSGLTLHLWNRHLFTSITKIVSSLVYCQSVFVLLQTPFDRFQVTNQRNTFMSYHILGFFESVEIQWRRSRCFTHSLLNPSGFLGIRSVGFDKRGLMRSMELGFLQPLSRWMLWHVSMWVMIIELPVLAIPWNAQTL